MSKTTDRRISGPLLQKQNQYGLWVIWPEKRTNCAEKARWVFAWIQLSLK